MSFSYPPPFGAVGDYSSDLNFTLGSTVNIQWSGQPSTATLWLFRDIEGITCTEWNLASTYCTRILSSFQNQNSYSWQVQTYASSYDNKIEPYYFVMGPEPPRVSGISAFDSHYFNIVPTGSASSSTAKTTSTYAVVTAGSSASSVTSSRSSTATSGSSATSSVASSTSTRATSTLATSASSSTGSGTATSLGASGTSSSTATSVPAVSNAGLTTGTKAAIGVAVGVGIPLIALLAYIAWILSRKRSKKNDTAATAAAATPNNKTTSSYQGYPELSHDAAIKQNIAELTGGGGAPVKSGAYPTYSHNPPPMSELPGQQQYQPPPTHYELPGEGIRR